MIRTRSLGTPYRLHFTNGSSLGGADAARASGGREDGFQPQELLEAALAASMNITLQMYAELHRLPLRRTYTRVRLERRADRSVFHYSVDFEGPLTEDERQRLAAVARHCPLRRMLGRPMDFVDDQGAPEPEAPVVDLPMNGHRRLAR